MLTSHHKLNQWYFSHSAFERLAIIKKNRNWSCVAMQKKYIESVHGFSTAWHHLIFPWLIDSIQLFSNQQILLHKCIENLHLVLLCQMKTVNLTFRSSLIGWFHCSSTCKREKVHNSGEVYEHEKSNKIEWEEDINKTAKESGYSTGILKVPYELLKELWWLESLITWCDRLLYPMDKWIGRNILKLESQSENNYPKHWIAIYVLPTQQWEVEHCMHLVLLESTSSIFLEIPKVLIATGPHKQF